MGTAVWQTPYSKSTEQRAAERSSVAGASEHTTFARCAFSQEGGKSESTGHTVAKAIPLSHAAVQVEGVSRPVSHKDLNKYCTS